MNCKICKYFTPRDSLGEIYGSCDCPKMHYTYDSSLILKLDEVRIEIDEGWGMHVGPEFGCIHYEKI